MKFLTNLHVFSGRLGSYPLRRTTCLGRTQQSLQIAVGCGSSVAARLDSTLLNGLIGRKCVFHFHLDQTCPHVLSVLHLSILHETHSCTHQALSYVSKMLGPVWLQFARLSLGSLLLRMILVKGIHRPQHLERVRKVSTEPPG